MNKERKLFLLSRIESELKSLYDAFEVAKKLAVDFSDASPSQSGERVAYNLAAEMAEATLNKFLSLQKEVESCSDQTVQIVQPVCYLEIDYGDGENEQCYLVNNSVRMEKITFITPQSALGEAILNKKAGEFITYPVSRDDGKSFISCKIVLVE
jgi:hypothetical protein